MSMYGTQPPTGHGLDALRPEQAARTAADYPDIRQLEVWVSRKRKLSVGLANSVNRQHQLICDTPRSALETSNGLPGSLRDGQVVWRRSWSMLMVVARAEGNSRSLENRIKYNKKSPYPTIKAMLFWLVAVRIHAHSSKHIAHGYLRSIRSRQPNQHTEPAIITCLW
ncbi:hypothetical protein LZ32DRAFT_78461 [Colletotrichum eremochloae]|nr:hypothetical protein LZ32DRAFT_78461 [Colletotrichum eremochloae]